MAITKKANYFNLVKEFNNGSVQQTIIVFHDLGVLLVNMLLHYLIKA